MPPRQKKAVLAAFPSPPLADCNIAISGSFPGYTQAAIDRDLISALGASLARSISSSTTHLVTTEADYNKPSAKVKSALSQKVEIVNFSWLQDCLAQNSRLTESDYGFDTASQPQTDGARKRAAARSPALAQDESQPKKKAKVSQSGPSEPKVADGQVAKSLDAKIPLDEGSESLGRYEVYIDDSGVIYDAALNQTNSSNNNNKFYRIQLLRSVAGDYKTWTRWGRVGEHGQTKVLGNGTLGHALREFDSKFKGKSGLSWDNRGDLPKPNKYAFIERSYEPDSDGDDDENDDEADGKKAIKIEDDENKSEPESKLSKPVQDLMKLIFNKDYFAATMADLNYDAQKLPLGKLSQSTISKGYQALKDLSALLDHPSLATSAHGADFHRATEQLSNLYFTLIPHAFGRNMRPPVIRSSDLLKKEIELLDSLGDLKDASLLMKKDRKEEINELDRQFRGLGLQEMTALNPQEEEFLQLKQYLMDTRGATHNANYTVSQIFRIEREGETARFEEAHGASSDRRLLWHGSRCTNFGGILSQGLRIAPPEAPVSGYMFGKGIYLADMSSKSANYCCPYITNGHALLLLCEAELGNPIQTLTDASYTAGEDAKSQGMLSTWGQGITGPSQWKDGSCIHPSLKGVKVPDTNVAKPGPTGIPNAYLLYNEFICYDITQVRLRYLLRVRM
ncbi:poly polymerase catalytic domain-containing protein [Xylariomycetidae sp. FL2044]|nr:poly polymerase catalytic domain-containing protein [Xylariomycetidae sp. FL2044]